MILCVFPGAEEWSLVQYADDQPHQEQPEAQPPAIQEPKPRKSLARQRFYRSPEWKAARAQCLAEKGDACEECGARENINVDHILPRSKFPELALVQANLRPLCWPCNKRKAASVRLDDALTTCHV